MSLAGRMSKMKTRDLIARLNELQCVYAGQTGSHCKYRTPCGQSITFKCNKMNEELSLNVYSSVRRVLRAEGLDIDGTGYQQATCGDFVGAHRHVAGLDGDVVPFTRRLTKEQSEKRFIKDRAEWYGAVTTPGSPVWAIIGKDRLSAVIHDPAKVRNDGRLSDYLIVRLEHGELHSVPTPMVAVRQTTEGRLLQFPKLKGLQGTRGEMVDAGAVVQQFSKALGEFGVVLLDFASPTSGPRGVFPAANVGGAVVVGIRDDVVVGAEGKAAVKRVAKLIGKPIEVPSLSVFGGEEGGSTWATQNGVVYVWVLPFDDAQVAATVLEASPEPLAMRVSNAILSVTLSNSRMPEWYPASMREPSLDGLPTGWVSPPGLSGFAGDLVPFRRMSMQQEIEHNPSAWYAAVTTIGSPVWVEHNGKVYRGVVVTPSKAQGSKMRSMTRAAVEIEGSAVPHYIRPDKMVPRPGYEADVLPFRLGGLGAGSDADYYGEARMALDEEARYVQERWASMTPAEHRAEAKGARQMAEAMARSAMREADGKMARYLQGRVVFYNKQAAEHERAALRKQRSDEA